MKNWFLHRGLAGLLAFIAVASAGLPASAPNEKPDVLLSAMQDELQRAQSSLGKLDPAPYFLVIPCTTTGAIGGRRQGSW